MEDISSAYGNEWYGPKMLAARTTLAAAEADLRGAWDEVDFLASTVPLLPAPGEIAWVAVYLTAKNLELLRPPPEVAEIAAAGAHTAHWSTAPAGAAEYASMVLSTVAGSIVGVTSPIAMELLVVSTGAVLELDAPPARHASAGLFAAVSYSFVRTSLHLGLDPLETVIAVRDALPT